MESSGIMEKIASSLSISEQELPDSIASSDGDSCSCGSDELLVDNHDEEEEDDRYCSANSALGTPSISSSLGNPSDFSSLPFLSLSDRTLPNPNHAAAADADLQAADRNCVAAASGEPIGSDDGGRLEGEGEGSMVDGDGRSEVEGSMVRGDGRSEVEGSMVDGDVTESGATGRSTNPLVMGSTVAFGDDDWDEFMRESDAGGLAPLYLYDEHPAWKQHHLQPPLPVAETKDPARDVPTQQVSVTDTLEQSGETDAVREFPNDHSVSHAQENPLRDELAEEIGKSLMQNDSATPRLPLDATVGACQGEELQLREIQQEKPTSPNDISHQAAGFLVASKQILDSTGMVEEGLALDEANKLDVIDSFDDMVLEMEEILLDSREPHGIRFPIDSRKYTTQQSHHFRDGSSTASTSGTDEAYPLSQYPSKIDWVEVVGAKQRQGDVSFGERMVGVKEYTVYILRVWSGNNKWEIEHRYRDFFALYRQLKTLFTAHGLNLPSPWLNVERESRKIFGNASPNVVSERSDLIQDCLRSILISSYPFGMPSFLITFLSPGRPTYKSSFLKTFIPQPLQKLGDDMYFKEPDNKETSHEDGTLMGKTISLVVEIRPHKTTRQLLELQHYTCAGCHRHLHAGRSLLQELAQTIGWNKPRFCAYTGQLFCASCHANDSAVLPARVLHFWDFSLYPVSQLAKAYLESIYDQPMLCVSAVNPFLFSKVPALRHIMSIRKKIVAMLPYIHCPFRSTIQKGLGIRRYLLESNDFFALHDLVDLSKGAFAALPVMMETISSRVLEHITQQCLVCYDAGVPCAARQACDDPVSLIFPFQEAEAAKCCSCGSIFHKPCFEKLNICHCGKPANTSRRIAPLEQARNGVVSGPGGLLGELIQPPVSSSSSGFFSDVLSNARPDKIWKPGNGNPVILMGSLPSASI